MSDSMIASILLVVIGVYGFIVTLICNGKQEKYDRLVKLTGQIMQHYRGAVDGWGRAEDQVKALQSEIQALQELHEDEA